MSDGIRTSVRLRFCYFSFLFALPVLGCTNFHEVAPGHFYRSGQLTSRQLHQAIDRHGIRTVINLRGADPGERWYEAQRQACAERGVTHHDLSMSARRIPHKHELCSLLQLLQEAVPPVLVHCRGGSDRTGLAAALWVLERDGSKRKARQQLSERYFHFQRLSPAQRYFLRRYQGATWAREVYDPCGLGLRYYGDHYCQQHVCQK
ncbi:MAG: dual specificity protein phosphatase family protein [Planctomycetota bacterium]